MHRSYLDQTLPTPAENLACDEALLDLCDSGDLPGVLRFWEAPAYFIVLGYSNQARREVDLDACAAQGFPVLRRCSGGGTVLQGPGCLNYSLILEIQGTPAFETIRQTTEYILNQHEKAIAALLPDPVATQGLSDLTWQGLKFSGNAQRRKRRALLFHGTFLYRFDLPLIGKVLPLPSREPDYRNGRPHDQFLINLPVAAEKIKAALRHQWHALSPLSSIPQTQIARLCAEKYSQQAWNFKF